VIPAICIFEKPSHGTTSIIKNERHEISNNIYPIDLTIDHFLKYIRITKIRILGLIFPKAVRFIRAKKATGDRRQAAGFRQQAAELGLFPKYKNPANH
jgi:hypothetical protein